MVDECLKMILLIDILKMRKAPKTELKNLRHFFSRNFRKFSPLALNILNIQCKSCSDLLGLLYKEKGADPSK